VVVFSPQRGFAVHEIGATQPIFMSDAFGSAPKSIAWIATNFVAWNPTEVALINGDDGQTLWKMSLASLPEIEVVPAPGGAGEAPEGQAEEDLDPRARALLHQLNRQGVPPEVRARILADQRRVRLAVQVGPQPQLAAAVAGPEQIASVRPLSDRVVLGTTTGRVVAVDLGDGSILWQGRPTDRGPVQFLASDDFVVLRVLDESGAQIIVLDALSGQFVSRRAYGNDGAMPVNMALAADGTLVWVMPDRVCGKDLFEPGDRLTFEQIGAREGTAPPLFQAATGADHLQIADFRILVLSDNGTAVRVYSLENGKPLRGEGSDLFYQIGGRRHPRRRR
jgi:hypothetical protein